MPWAAVSPPRTGGRGPPRRFAGVRDPVFYPGLAEKVLPALRSWPHIKAWHAGCATGEEVYSHALLLKEAGLLERSTRYATDVSQPAGHPDRQGRHPLARRHPQGGARTSSTAGPARRSPITTTPP